MVYPGNYGRCPISCNLHRSAVPDVVRFVRRQCIRKCGVELSGQSSINIIVVRTSDSSALEGAKMGSKKGN